jgi:hypothetical protein
MKTSIVVDGVTYYREQPELTKAKEVVEKYEWLKAEITSTRGHAQEQYDDCKSHGLSFAAIDAEGYLRCAIQLCELVKHIEETFTSPEL